MAYRRIVVATDGSASAETAEHVAATLAATTGAKLTIAHAYSNPDRASEAVERAVRIAEREGATSFDAPGAKYTHRGNKCSFETLVDEYKIDDPAIALLAKVVHGADVSEDREATPESAGLVAIAHGFSLLGVDDQRQLELELPVYDALYAWAQHQVSAG